MSVTGPRRPDSSGSQVAAVNRPSGPRFGASVTLDIGWSGDENALESALDVSSAGAMNWTAVDDSTPLTAAKTLQAHFEGANPADDQSLEVWLLALVSL